MNDRWWVAVLVYPAPLYVAISVLAHFGSSGVAFPLGFLFAAVFGTATGFGLVRHPAWVWSGRAFVLLAIFVPALFGSSASVSSLDFAGGALVGAPFLWLEYAWRDSVTPGARIVALQGALLIGVLGLAAIAWTPVPPGSGGWAFLQAVEQVTLAQYKGIGALLGGSIVNSMPLESALDLAFVGLGALALAGVLASWTSPRTALLEPLPWSWVRPRGTSVSGAPTPEELGLRPGQREALATRSLPSAPEEVVAPSSGPLLLTALLVFGFLVLAVSAPSFALLVLVLASVGGVLAVGLTMSRRLTPLGDLGG
jgi:hypothetical protein